MHSDSSLEQRLGPLRALAAAQGVHPTDDDLVAVLGFLDGILPALHALEERLPPSLGTFDVDLGAPAPAPPEGHP